jgi:hypothetical protein
MTETTVSADLLQPLQILTELAVHSVGQNLRVLAVDNVALSVKYLTSHPTCIRSCLHEPVEEPCWDLVLRGVLDDSDDTLELFGGDLSGALVEVN